jgi:hypothetical protein
MGQFTLALVPNSALYLCQDVKVASKQQHVPQYKHAPLIKPNAPCKNLLSQTLLDEFIELLVPAAHYKDPGYASQGALDAPRCVHKNSRGCARANYLWRCRHCCITHCHLIPRVGRMGGLPENTCQPRVDC